MPKKQILLLHYDLSAMGGITRVVSLLSHQLNGEYDVHILSLTGTGPFPFSLPEGCCCEWLLPGKLRIRQVTARGIYPLRHYLKEHKIEAILMLGNWGQFVPIVATWKSRIPLIACDHGAISRRKQHPYTQAEIWSCFHAAKRVVVLTAQAREIVRARYPFATDKCVVIPNCISVPTESAPFYPAPRELVTLARISDDKAIPNLISVAHALKKRVPDFIWRVWGDGPERTWMEAEIKKYGLEQNLLLMGVASDASTAYCQAGTAVLTTPSEGLPLALLEPKALRLPLVSFDIPCGPSDLIRNGVDGFLIPYGDFDAMAEKLALLITDDALAQSMRERTAENMDRYMPQTVRGQWISLINAIT